ncbi:hypothetical protein BDV23DRAFT_189719 [Aspergillus alliaceus]|uniref:Uncharacterized protein n=1 Tax=Petromyces alliaceus TaxID=209559 RepID=A0A5N7BQ22_PETAA|nr:hypothetical protein BDV23DRAFT_189719 [Aspergillus alliaceus]
MPSRGHPYLYPTTAEKNAARAICRKQYKANSLPPPPLNTQLEHLFITWNPAEGPVADPPITQTTDIFTDLHQTILSDDVAALLDYTSNSSTSVDPSIEDNAAEMDNMDLERDSNTGSHNYNESQYRHDRDEPPPSGMLAATDTEAPRLTYIQVTCLVVPLAADDIYRQAILAQELTQHGVESTYTGDSEPSELVGVQEEQHPPPVCDPEQDNIQPDHAFQIQFDINSAGGFASSLAVTRQGLHWTAVRSPVSNLTSSLHLAPVPVQFEDPETKRWRWSQH